MPARTSEFSGLQKAAQMLIILGDEASGRILKQLDEAEVEMVGREVARAGAISSEQAHAVLAEFQNMVVAHEYMLQGGAEYARKLLVNAFGPEAARKMFDRLMNALTDDSASFTALQKADPQQLARFIHSEHPQTIALILSHLNATQAAVLLSSLPVELQHDVAVRMANLEQTSPEVISRIAAVVGQKLKALGEMARESYGGVRAVAEMFNRLDSATSKEILERIERNHPNLAGRVRHLMFVFEDLLRIDAIALKEVLARTDRKILTLALKGTGDELRKHFLQGMSQRGAEMLLEDMDALGPVKIRDVEAAQQQIIAILRQLESEGLVSLKAGVGEQYVE